MKNRMNKKSVMAIFSACVCALLFLCASAARPTKAYADSISLDEEITIRALSRGELSGSTAGLEADWAVFYRGIELLSEAKWKMDGDEGTVEFSDNKIVAVYDSTGEPLGEHFEDGDIAGTPLDTDHAHDFTSGAGSYDWEPTDNGHYAVCDCGFELEVAHRPDGRGVCMDCGESVVDLSGYENIYTFTIPGPEELDNSMSGENWEGNELTINISVDADLRAGDTLELYLVCANVLTSESGISEISYTMKVESDIDGSTWAEDSPSGGDSEPIWSYQAPIPEEYDPDNFKENFMTNIQGAITITLTVEEADYPGTYTDTLTFSANILEYVSEES